MNKIAIIGFVLAASLAAAPLAFAADTTPVVTGPNTAACLTAQAEVKIRVESAARASIKFDDASDSLTPAEKTAIETALGAFNTARDNLNTALDALKAAPTVANATAAQQAGAALTAAAAELIATTGADLADAKQALIDANAALQIALDNEGKACAGDPVVVTTTPAPTTSAVPTIAPVTTTVPTTTTTVVPVPAGIDTGRA